MGNRSQELHASPVGHQRGGIWVWHQNHAAATRSRATSRSSLISLFSWEEQKTAATDELHGRGRSGDTETSGTGPLWKMTCRPGSCQTPNRRLAPQGWWGDKQERGEGEAEECAAGWMTSVTPCFRFPWRRDLTPPTPPSCPFPTGAAHTHHARTAWWQTDAGAGGAQQLCCTSPLLLFDFLPSTSAG